MLCNKHSQVDIVPHSPMLSKIDSAPTAVLHSESDETNNMSVRVLVNHDTTMFVDNSHSRCDINLL